MITNIYIDNFRSLKDVHLSVPNLGYFCGPNGSGKTNLAEAIDFLSKAFSNDLSYAVAEKGGFYNMCYRKERRSRGAISFAVKGVGHDKRFGDIEYMVAFGLRTKGETIRADYYVATESYDFTFRPDATSSFNLKITRNSKEYNFEVQGEPPTKAEPYFYWIRDAEKIFQDFIKPDDRSLLYPKQIVSLMGGSRTLLEPQRMRVYRLSPRYASAAGAPSVSGELGKYGENLPSALDYLSSHDPNAFHRLQSWVRDVIPDLEYLKTDYTQTRQMGLFLQERGFGNQWYAEELSDGTLMSIALFLAIVDSRNRLVFIEEPENSLHPWILQTFLQCCREESRNRQVLISTQSPIVVATATPENLFLVERGSGKTHVSSVRERDPDIDQIIDKHYLDLGAYWLSGGLRAVPKPSEDAMELLFNDDAPAEEPKQ